MAELGTAADSVRTLLVLQLDCLQIAEVDRRSLMQLHAVNYADLQALPFRVIGA